MADPQREADVTVDLEARQGKTKLASGREIEGFTLNGKTPGPTITATEGQLVEVHLRNASVDDGVVAALARRRRAECRGRRRRGDAERRPQGGQHTYRFVADQVGTYWYHSHQVSHEQVIGGLLGSLVVLPKDGIDQDQDDPAASRTPTRATAPSTARKA